MRKHYTATFRAQVVQELLKEDKTIAQIAAEYEVHPSQLNKWESTALQGLPSLFYVQFYNYQRLHQSLDYQTPAAVYFCRQG